MNTNNTQSDNAKEVNKGRVLFTDSRWFNSIWHFSIWLRNFTKKLANAADSGCYHIWMSEEARAHFGDPPNGLFHEIKCWCEGFLRGWRSKTD